MSKKDESKNICKLCGSKMKYNPLIEKNECCRTKCLIKRATLGTLGNMFIGSSIPAACSLGSNLLTSGVSVILGEVLGDKYFNGENREDETNKNV